MAGIDWRAARVELKRLREEPEDTEAGARLFRAFGGEPGDDRVLARMRETAEGRHILSARPDLLRALSDRARLRSLADGTLGREYVRFAEREQIFPEGLQEIMARVEGEHADDEVAFVHARGRALHDLLHVITGYGRDPAGEVALLAFTAVQNGSRALDWLSLLGCWKTLVRGRPVAWRLRRSGRRRARRSAWMFDRDWEALLERPIDDVRRELGLWPVPVYEPVPSN